MTAEGGVTAPTGRSHVFISYARVDRPRVAKIADALTARGIDVWWDVLIEGGATFARSIETALSDADAVIVVWSAASITSDWVRDEAAHARDRGRLVPLSLDGVGAPLGFGQYHSLAFKDWRGNAQGAEIDELMRALATACGAPAPPRRAAPGGRSRRGVLVAGAVAGLAAVAGGGGYLAWRGGVFASAAHNSVAVLPFRNLSGDPTQTYFSDGLCEEVRQALLRNPQLQVLATTSSNTVRDSTEDAVAIAAKLGVAFLLEGSVRRAGDAVRISAELVDGRTGFSRWSNSFDRKLADIFSVQTEISDTVAQALSTRMTRAQPGVGGTTSVAAYDAYLRGLEQYHLDTGATADRAALAEFDAAIAADPAYAAAHAARSKALAVLANEDATADQLVGLHDASIAAARRAIALAPELADAHLALGDALFFGRLNVQAAREPYDRAAVLGAGDANILMAVAFYRAVTARSGAATTAIDRALILDPLNPRAFRTAGWVSFAARRYAQSIPPMQRALALNPNIVGAHAGVGGAFLMLARLTDARDAYRAESSAPFRLSGLAIVEHRLSRDSAAQAAFTTLVTDLGDSALYQQAQVLAQWGRRDDALAILNRARVVGDSGLIYARTDPLLDPLRADSRFVALLRGLGFD